jgi:hypothetical protein
VPDIMSLEMPPQTVVCIAAAGHHTEVQSSPVACSGSSSIQLSTYSLECFLRSSAGKNGSSCGLIDAQTPLSGSTHHAQQ